MDLKTATEIIQGGESQTVEFKRSTAKLKNAAETLCAFLNGGGGAVFIGVTDNKKLVGQQVTDQTKLEIANILKKFEPSANIEVDYVELDDDKQIIVLYRLTQISVAFLIVLTEEHMKERSPIHT